MAFNINNQNALERIENCLNELIKIEHLIEGMGSMSHPVSYLTRYAIIKSCGTIEYSFKTIICDYNYSSHSAQAKKFIDGKFRNSSMNPSFSNIIKGLEQFDENWSMSFNKKIKTHPSKDKLHTSLSSLNTARNTFAHGNNPSTSFNNVKEYFIDAVKIIELMELAIIETETAQQEQQ
ncbi:HEPN domain-containing protein [Pectobacterium odoriferum]|uniref:HEPN domain-containing protein n=1 Tax=Pectobacterium odoriferum TaxID=78398 RepID=UPI0015DDFA35|nr:HEPN domain-containing protein [Pectobacterium odoriferum]MBA0188163.1 hypothetical protein [Pectobacterium odoriferum]